MVWYVDPPAGGTPFGLHDIPDPLVYAPPVVGGVVMSIVSGGEIFSGGCGSGGHPVVA